jgi:hypothetical protein
LESVTKEKESTKAHYEALLEQEHIQAEEREFAMKKEFGNKLNDIEEQYNGLREQFDANLIDERELIRAVSKIERESIDTVHNSSKIDLQFRESKKSTRSD